MTNTNKPNPDDRSDNAKKLKKMVKNTIENMEAAEETMEHTIGNNQEAIREKNERRKESIEGFRKEILDEAENRNK
ncbi:small acid-soluble spore protein (thioredoxin-like protein) [Psychrobacillus psychrotolerans]|uniref:Small, acid-soluble spore protein Tlp n=2 Tax=Psychrobacillus psychrotolerans TaxID=126156 RepID=A0A1I5XVP2_9BACI|nr:small acid-soluble spore protein Tlp [Psychrobacillus psychrotolerans]SFQ36029.1 small acid-soluble spore protein (thioredoxin-like protein) [Psychrobacillus psychrotolerans]